MCSCSSRWCGSVSSRNASSSPARARARFCSVTFASSHQRFLSPPSHVMTAGRMEIRRSILLASNASTENTNERRTEMGKIVISGPQNVSLDGVVQDPDGEEGFRLGGWFGEVGGKDLEEGSKLGTAPACRS